MHTGRGGSFEVKLFARPRPTVYALTHGSISPGASHSMHVILCENNIDIQGGPKKWDHRLITIILSYLNRLIFCS